jgi:hypothetical protein
MIAIYLGVALPEELEPEVSLLLLEPVLPELLPLRSEPLEPLLLPPGVKAPPVAELLPESPKNENTLCLQLGWVRSVLASKVGADSSLLVSPAKVKLGCCEELVVAELLLELDELPELDVRSSIQGTATCLPLPEALAELAEPIPVLLELELGDVLLVELELGDVLLELALPLNERIANSNRPEFGLTTKSLIVPISVPAEPLTCAPVN